MTLRTLIIDDEPLAHDIILTFARDIPFLEIVGQCYSATEALTYLNNRDIDLIFLDIQMPVLTGMEFLKVLKNAPQVIMTTAYQEYALDSYEFDVTDYLLKPFRFDRFLQAANKALIRNNAPNLLDKNSPSHIFIKVDRKQIQLSLAEVSCLEAYGNYVKVWLGETCLLTPKTLTSFEQLLPKKNFIRIHKSVIVNKSHIDYVEGDNLKLKDGKMLSIGKQHKTTLKNFLG